MSLSVSLTPPSSAGPAYIRTSFKESPTLPPCHDSLPSPATPIVVHPTPRASYLTLERRESDPGVEMATALMPVGSDATSEVAPQVRGVQNTGIFPWVNTYFFAQNTPSLFDGASNASSALLPSPIGVPSFSLPGEPIGMLTGDTTSIHTGATELSAQEDLAYKGFSSQDSLNYSAIDAFPSSVSINHIPSISPFTPDLHLHNFPIPDGPPLEPHSVYFSAVEGDLSMSQRSEDGPEPVHETSTSSESALELCIPSAEEAHYQICWQENPSPRRRTARIEVQSDVFQLDGHGVMRPETFTYACKSLPYDAGLRPHAYVDNHEYTTNGKNRLETLAEDLYAMEGFMEEDYVVGGPNRPPIFRKLAGGKRISKFMALKLRITPKQFSAHSCVTDPQFPTTFSPVNFTDRNPVTANHPNDPSCPPLLSPSSPPPYSPTPNQKRPRALFKMAWPGPRPLSMFLIPKPKVEGKVAPSPKELPTCLPAEENPPPLSPHTSPRMRSAQIPEIDVHGRSYGPSRVTVRNLSPMSPDPSVFGRKERRSWLTNVRSPKNSPLTT